MKVYPVHKSVNRSAKHEARNSRKRGVPGFGFLEMVEDNCEKEEGRYGVAEIKGRLITCGTKRIRVC